MNRRDTYTVVIDGPVESTPGPISVKAILIDGMAERGFIGRVVSVQRQGSHQPTETESA
jgi:hypothetical protein